MKDLLANATAHLYSLGLKLEHPPYNAAMPITLLNTITDAYFKFDHQFTGGSKPQSKEIPEKLRPYFLPLENTVNFEHGQGLYRMGVIDTGLRSDHYKPSGKNLEALALLGMIVEATEAFGMNLGQFGALTMIDEAGILTSSKFIGKLAVVNIFYPVGSAYGKAQYDPSDITQNKLKLQKAHQACNPELDEILAEIGLLEITHFSFETILRAIRKENIQN